MTPCYLGVMTPTHDKQAMHDVVEMQTARMKTALTMAAQAGITRVEAAKIMDLPSSIVGEIVHRWGIEMETR